MVHGQGRFVSAPLYLVIPEISSLGEGSEERGDGEVRALVYLEKAELAPSWPAGIARDGQ